MSDRRAHVHDYGDPCDCPPDPPAELVEKARAAFEAVAKADLDSGRRYEERMNAATTAALSAAGVPALLAEVERLRNEVGEALLPVMAGLQDLGNALGVGLGQSITGTGVEKARALVARATSAEQERDEARRDLDVVSQALAQYVSRLRMGIEDVLLFCSDREASGALASLLAGSGEQPGEDCENHGERANDGQAFCCGCGTCQATEHIHGCFADNGACEYPDDHHPAPVVPDSPDVRDEDWWAVRGVLAVVGQGVTAEVDPGFDPEAIAEAERRWGLPVFGDSKPVADIGSYNAGLGYGFVLGAHWATHPGYRAVVRSGEQEGE